MINIDDRFITQIMPKIGAKQTAVLLAICKHLDVKKTAFPSKYTIQKYTGLGRDSVSTSIKLLTENGLLEKEQRRKGNRQSSNLYKVKCEFINVFIKASNELVCEDFQPTESQPTENPPLSINKIESINKDKEIDFLKNEIEKLKKENESLRKGAPTKEERENQITQALNFLHENYPKRKINIELTAHRKIVNACLNAFPLEEIKKGIMQTIGEKVGNIWKDGTNQEKHLNVATIFAVKNMEKYISKSDENGGVIISTDDVENILDIWIGLGRTPKTIYDNYNKDYLIGLRARIREILNEGEKTKEDIVYMIKRAYTFSQHYHKLENILRDVKYMFEQFDKADKQIAQGTRKRGNY